MENCGNSAMIGFCPKQKKSCQTVRFEIFIKITICPLGL